MKRKLISFDAFKQIQEASLINAQEELIGAEEVLSRTLGVEDLELYTFGESDVTYEAPDGCFIHATYKLDNDKLVLENIEQLVIEEESEKLAARSILSKMVDSLLENNEAQANKLFDEYLETPVVQREFVSEAYKAVASKPTGKASPLRHKKQKRSDVMKRIRARMKTLKKESPGIKKQKAMKRKIAAQQLGGSKNPRWRTYVRKVKPKTMKEWSTLSENVLSFLDYRDFGPIANESMVRTDAKGNVVAVAVPTIQKRNEAKVLSFDWKCLDTEVKVLRNAMKKLAENQNFVKAMIDLKRYNNISDDQSMHTTLEAIVSHWPDILYVTEDELAAQIGTALESANISNYDDATCQFMAEAILRTAHHAYTDKVRKIGSLAKVEGDITSECKDCEDSYKDFQEAVATFYNELDESAQNEMKVFADLYQALHEMHRAAHDLGDEMTRSEVENFMRECASILNKEVDPDMKLAEEIAFYLADFTEANVEGAEDEMGEPNAPHHTVNGDHPMTMWNAKQAAVASKHNGDYGDAQPVSDGKSYKGDMSDEMKNRGWGNMANDKTWPDLDNPMSPKGGEFKMKEKSAVDDGESDWSRWQSEDTWPNLKNPYVPAAK